MRLLALLPLAAGSPGAKPESANRGAGRRRAAFSFSEAADSLKLDEASSQAAADAAAKASSSFLDGEGVVCSTSAATHTPPKSHL